MSNQYEEGKILLINKPKNWTSFDVVKKLRFALKVKKIGHAGTLDPLATGLLIIGTGKFTKKLHELQGLDKSYEGKFEIGKTTPSYDLETAFDSIVDISHLKPEDFERARKKFSGLISQIPPAHSAVKVDGERAYKKARKNQEVKLNPREVVVSKFEIDTTELPDVLFNVDCSKGTYIRSLARDFGQELGVGAYLKELIRTRIGQYHLSEAEELETFIQQHHESN
ncbi:MAG: tRNA pseudouridine(55) synthase TruB [Cyclobacteriaceae bacterium]